MKDRDRLLKLCVYGLQARGLAQDQRYKDRLKKDLKEIDAQGEHEYFLNLHDKFKRENLIFKENQHNNIVDFLLFLTDEFDVEKPSEYIQGEFPDIDIDYIKEVRDDLKRNWAAEQFGQEFICEIGTYGTSGIKGAILDMARVHNLPKGEIQPITVKMEDKDDEGHELEWDKALEIYPEFRDYCERNQEVAECAHILLDRIRSSSVHAGGLIVSDRRIDGFVPLEVRMVNKENPDGVICSAWTEGLSRQDLQPVGLIKFDLLVVNNLKQIAVACNLVKERHGIDKICALPGQWDFSDLSYLNDPKCIEMANRADLKCIFQFDSEGIRKLVKRGGVSSFDDIAAYSALYRPGCLMMGMDVTYCRRKKGEEPYSIHPLMQKTLGATYGVLIYQEQIMEILRVVGEIPEMHTEKVRKAISKKNIKGFIKYKEVFVENGQKNLNANKDYVENLWSTIESFAEYGFNKSHSYAYAYISARLLWLKAHYPLEFYTATLMCAKNTEKFKDYKLDAERHGIEICPVHINKSKKNFSINGEKIYFGFSNIKNIGATADRIVENQPYADYPDFLDKYGTDATTLKALTSLGVFEEKYDRVTLRKFCEWYKTKVGARKDRKKRFEQTLLKKLEELKKMLLTEIQENDPDFEKMCAFTPEAEALWQSRFAETKRQVAFKYRGENRTKDVPFISLLEAIVKRREKSISSESDKKEMDSEPVTMDRFDPESVKLDDEEIKILTDELVLNGHKSYPMAESMYYGFQWTHLLETSPDYTGATIDKFLEEAEKGLIVGNIEIQIISVKKRLSKSNVTFYSVEVEDSNGKRMTVNVWQDDYNRFEEELKEGKLLSIQVNPPGGGFNTLTFKSVPRHERKKLPAKEEDSRLIVMRVPERNVKKEEVLDDLKLDDEIKFDSSAVQILTQTVSVKPLLEEPFFGD
jgi:DNA polymerase III alpha subunit